MIFGKGDAVLLGHLRGDANVGDLAAIGQHREKLKLTFGQTFGEAKNAQR